MPKNTMNQSNKSNTVNKTMPIVNILGIESSCDDTSAAVVSNGVVLSNVVSGQEVHRQYGGVVPELASRAHQQNIVPVIHRALEEAGMVKEEIDAVAFTRGPGLMGALLVGNSFAKGFTLAMDIPLIEVNHLHAHVLSVFLSEKEGGTEIPAFPFLCLLVSGGHTQIIRVDNYLDMKVLGTTIDDAAGETFDKCAKVMGLPYPGGPIVDKHASEGRADAFIFAKPRIAGYDFSFSGLKTSFLYFLRDRMKEDQNFIQKNINDLCASIQSTIIDVLIKKFMKAADDTGIKTIAIAGGVAANSGLREEMKKEAERKNLKLFLPEKKYTTDNAAMIAFAGYHKFLRKEFAEQDVSPLARFYF